MWNSVATIVLITYYLITSTVLFVVVDKLGLYKVASEDQIKGLDKLKHDEAAYSFGKYALKLLLLFLPSKDFLFLDPPGRETEENIYSMHEDRMRETIDMWKKRSPTTVSDPAPLPANVIFVNGRKVAPE